MSPSESSPLLPNGNGHGHSRDRTLVQRAIDTIKGGEDEPSWLESYRFLFLGSWLNLFLIFVPLSFLSDKLEWDAALRFSFRHASFLLVHTGAIMQL
jgi:Ca2+:H+ antiporter